MSHLTFFKKLSVAPTLGLIFGVALAAFGQTPKTDEARELPPGQMLERQMTGEETHRYKINLKPDEFFQVRVEQKGVDRFYSDYKKPNFNKAEALRQAQLVLLGERDRATGRQSRKPGKALPGEFAHPFYWSPFILIGNWQ